MATTGIWKIEKRLDHVLDYVMNPEKTLKDNSSYQELHKLAEYEKLDFNSEEEVYVSGINCLPETAYKDMIYTKELFGKKDGILGYHAFQSYKEGEVTANQAHLIGLKLAEEMWGDKYEVIVTTHINTNHIHNHFVINSVSFKDGKKYHDCRENLALLRHTSDAICYEYGLSVLEEKDCKKGKVNYFNYYNGFVKKSDYHATTKQDIDRAIAMAYSYKDFENIMMKMGYEVINRYGKLSVKRSPYKRNIRIARAFGEEYTISSIEKRIENTTAPRVPFLEAYNSNNIIKDYKSAKKEKTHGLYGLYKYYCYILKTYSSNRPKKYISPAIREDIYRMDELSKQARLLTSKEIETYEQFLFYKDSLKNSISILTSKKDNLWKKIKKAKTDNDKQNIRLDIDEIKKELMNKRKEMKLCDDIEKRINVIKENIKDLSNDGKEKTENEF